MKIKAVFFGKNNSLGYVTGEEYDLFLFDNTIHRVDGTGKCVYGSVQSFIMNWEIIEIKRN